MNASVFAIGDEVLLGQISDTNSPWLSGQLTSLGVRLTGRRTLADDHPTLTQALLQDSIGCDLILMTGGLGPTEDDLTRFALADALAAPLETHPVAMEQIRGFFSRLGRSMPDRNGVQALLPRGAEFLDNPLGTAPGIRCRLNGCTVIALPGVPSEMTAMFRQHVQPWLQQNRAQHILTETVHLFGLAESRLVDQLGAELLDRRRQPLVGNTVRDGVITLRIRSTAASEPEARRALQATVAEIEARLGPLAFGRGSTTLPEATGLLLKEKNLTLATAESCTGGGLGELLTQVPGSSRYYLGGWVTYANTMKQNQLGIAQALLEQKGAVSREVALAMAENAQHRSGSDYALAITGIAGPDGGTPGKPVGTVWFALAAPTGATEAWMQIFPGDRQEVRRRSALAALNTLRLRLMGEASLPPSPDPRPE